MEAELTKKETNGSASRWATTLTGEMLLFGLLGKILLSNPEKSWLQPLLDEEVLLESPYGSGQPHVIQGVRSLTRWGDRSKKGIEDETLTDLKVDYTRLFTGIKKVPVAPWESVYFSDERLVFQAQTLDVRSWYRRYGLEAVNLHQEPDDHIGLELAFVSHLAKLGVAALEAKDEETFEALLQAQRNFLKGHLLRWGPLWCNLIDRYAETDFYRGIALVLWGGLEEVAADLGLEMPEVVEA